MRQQQDEPGRFSICSRQAAVVQTVSNQRLNRPMAVDRGWITQTLSREIVTNLQKAVIKAINATALVPAQQESEK
ncbi:hypothetical protein CI671_026640 [Escherichia coli]|nr:hypothetical protein CI671_026640 [Escherichia coli]